MHKQANSLPSTSTHSPNSHAMPMLTAMRKQCAHVHRVPARTPGGTFGVCACEGNPHPADRSTGPPPPLAGPGPGRAGLARGRADVRAFRRAPGRAPGLAALRPCGLAALRPCGLAALHRGLRLSGHQGVRAVSGWRWPCGHLALAGLRTCGCPAGRASFLSFLARPEL